MKMEFLGTGAADYNYPEDYALPERRFYSSVLIDDILLIDPGPHIFKYAEQMHRPDIFKNVKIIAVTHSHADHFCVESAKKLLSLSPDIFLLGNCEVGRLLSEDGVSCNFITAAPQGQFELEGYFITALAATHTESEQALYYSVENQGKKLLYATDGSWLPTSTWRFICGKQYDAMVFDLTIGNAEGDCRIFEHTSLPMLSIMLPSIGRQQALSESGSVIATHFAKTLHPDHKTLSNQLSAIGVIAAYDGMIHII